MTEAVVHVFPSGRLVALVGHPNAGKTALFNRLTGSRQKVANYAGVTIERKEGRLDLPSGKRVRILDLPGTRSLYPRSPDEKITCDVLRGNATGEKRPDLVVCVVDTTQLRRGLRLVLGVMRSGVPCVVALNMTDLAQSQGFCVDPAALAHELGVPVVATAAIRNQGAAQLEQLLDRQNVWHAQTRCMDSQGRPDHEVVAAMLRKLGLDASARHGASDAIDGVVLHPVAGPLLLALLLFLVFQAVFSWAAAPMKWIRVGTAWAGEFASNHISHPLLRSFVADALIAGAGSVLVFLPQILVLFFFILVLEESGYLPRAAFLLDRLMGSVGLSGRSFIPLLSSFACAVPGIMATRTIPNARDRLVTIMLAPLMTCSARLPVYALLIGAFVPARTVVGGLQLQGLVLFVLYLAGVLASMALAWTLQRIGGLRQARPLMMELPWYHLPRVRNIAIGLLQRTRIFLRRVGVVLVVLTVLLWALASFPAPPQGATGPAIQYSIAGMLGRALAVVLEPAGFNWQISLALVPGMAAREVVIGALGTVYALSATGTDTAQSLVPLLAGTWSPATGYALLAWFVFAPQCLSTLAAVRRETGQWRWPVIMASYLFALAYAAAWVTYRVASG